jgi:apolipoprotein N-acyltransferase
MNVAAPAKAGEIMRRLGGWRARSLAFAAGLVGVLGFAPFSIFPLLLLSIAVLVVLIDGAHMRGRPVRNSAFIGWFWGFGQFLGGLYWVGYAFMVDPAAHAWQLPFAIVLLTGGLALFSAAAAAFASVFWTQGPARYFVFSAAFGLCEWLRGHLLTGFPWNLAAYGWGASLGLLQSTAVMGAFGLTLLTFLFGAVLAEIVEPKPRLRLPAAMLVLFVLLWIGGEVRLARNPTETAPGAVARIVQPDVPQAEKYKRPLVLRNWQRLLALSAQPAKSPLKAIIWPEAAPPFLLQRAPGAIDEIAQLTAHGTVLMTGGVRFTDLPQTRFYNAFFIFGARARLLGIYDKFHLVPFGEYVPFAQIMNRIGITKLTEGEEGFSAGDGPHTFALPGLPSVDPLICYEILFPGAVIGTPRPGWIVNVTDDSWFGPSTGPYQHLLTARVRAIEEGVPVVRAANTGISAVIDPLGRTKAILPLDEVGVLDAPLPVAVAPTPYARFGDAAFWFMLVACALVGAGFRKK